MFMSFLTVISFYSSTTQICKCIYRYIYFFPSRTTSRSELSGESDSDENLKKSSKKRKKKKKKHHHYKTKKKAKGDSSSSESDLDTKHIKDRATASGRNREKEAAAKYVLINTMQNVNLLCFFYLSLQLYE